MARRKKVSENEFIRPTTGLVIGGSIFGIGAGLVAGVGGSTAASAGAGITAGASFLPPIGATIGAGLTLRQIRRLEDTTRKRRRR